MKLHYESPIIPLLTDNMVVITEYRISCKIAMCRHRILSTGFVTCAVKHKKESQNNRTPEENTGKTQTIA